jgi:arylformamidase
MVKKGWIDISVPLHDDMVHWTGDPPVQVVRVSDVERGDSHTLSKISMGSHTGTHIDAPLHFIKKGMAIDEAPLSSLVGRARVLEIKDTESIKLAELTNYGIRQGERILFKTGNSKLWQSERFVEEFVFISDEAAEFLAHRHIKVVGIDYLSVGGYKHGGFPHKVLLGAGTWIIEGLNLSQVEPGYYYLVCLPLRIEHGDGAPARAIIRPIQ